MAKANRPEIALGLQQALGNRGTLPNFELEEQLRPSLDVIALKNTPYAGWGLPQILPVPVAAIAAQAGIASLRPGPQSIVKLKRIIVSRNVAAITALDIWYLAQIQWNGAMANVTGPLFAARLRQLVPGPAMPLDNNTDWGFNARAQGFGSSLGAAFAGKLLWSGSAAAAPNDRTIEIDAELFGSGTAEPAGVAPANAQLIAVVSTAPVNQAFNVTFEFDEWPLTG